MDSQSDNGKIYHACSMSAQEEDDLDDIKVYQSNDNNMCCQNTYSKNNKTCYSFWVTQQYLKYAIIIAGITLIITFTALALHNDNLDMKNGVHNNKNMSYIVLTIPNNEANTTYSTLEVGDNEANTTYSTLKVDDLNTLPQSINWNIEIEDNKSNDDNLEYPEQDIVISNKRVVINGANESIIITN